MRFRELRLRERIERIVEDTVKVFLEMRGWGSREVRWQNRSWAGSRPLMPKDNIWSCNDWLNLIFSDMTAIQIRRDAAAACVSTSRGLRAPAQRAYVSLASSRRYGPMLATSRLSIGGDTAAFRALAISGGTHRIRFTVATAEGTFLVKKAGRSADPLNAEIAGRRIAVHAGVPVPDVLDHDSAGGWIREEYVSGVPVNRVSDRSLCRRALSIAGEALRRLETETGHGASLTTHVRSQLNLVEIGSRRLLGGAKVLALARAIAEQTEEAWTRVSAPFRLTYSHGDFQPGNVLICADRILLADWEFSSYRQSGYDAMTWLLRLRFPAGLAARARDVINGSKLDLSDPPVTTLVNANDRAARRGQIMLALLENLACLCTQHEIGRMVSMSDEMQQFVAEISSLEL